jgi:hypothetical protein
MEKASVVAKVNKKFLTITNTLAYYVITGMKRFMIQAPEVCAINLFTAAIVAVSY